MPSQASTCGMAPHKHLKTVPSYSLLGYFTIIRAHGHGASRGVLRQCQDTAELAKWVVGLSGACRQSPGPHGAPTHQKPSSHGAQGLLGGCAWPEWNIACQRPVEASICALQQAGLQEAGRHAGKHTSAGHATRGSRPCAPPGRAGSRTSPLFLQKARRVDGAPGTNCRPKQASAFDQPGGPVALAKVAPELWQETGGTWLS